MHPLLNLIHQRRSILPKRLGAPGPSEEQLIQLLELAATAPDHGLLRPWRLVLVPPQRREALAEAFVAALLARLPSASAEQQNDARAKAHRAPCLLLMVGKLRDLDPGIPTNERVISAGCAIQNLLLGAQALGYGAGLTTGQALYSQALRDFFRLNTNEDPLCFINIGTVQQQRPAQPRMSLSEFFSSL